MSDKSKESDDFDFAAATKEIAKKAYRAGWVDGQKALHEALKDEVMGEAPSTPFD